MRVASSFAVATLLLAVKGNGCEYEELTQDAIADIWACVGQPSNTPVLACDDGHQDRVEAAIATGIYGDAANCKCIYYDDTLAYTYKQSGNCWKIRGAEAGLKCWETGFSDYVTSGDLEAKLDEICPSLPSPECQDDALGELAAIPFTCSMLEDTSGGCDQPLNGVIGILLGEDHGYATVADICRGHCNPDGCDPFAPREGECQDDPDGLLAAVHSSCQSIVNDVAITCEDFTNVVFDTYGMTPAVLCPASCEESCRR